MKATVLSFVIFFVFLLAIPVFGAASDDETVTTRVLAKKSERLSFSGIKLKGQLKKPDLSYIYKRKGLRAEEIVNIPENFNDEIVQGAGEF